jgi:nitrite reductase/ring-hydroxylating ferredoxin subunit
MSETEQNPAAEEQAPAPGEAEARERIAYAICPLNDIPSQKAKGYHLAKITDDGREVPFWIIIIRWGKQVFGYVNRCPHDGVNLDWERNSFLDSNGIRLQCGKHGALFELGTGMCIDGPCKGRALTPVALQVIDNEVCVLDVRLAEDEPDEEDEPAEG